MATLMDLGVPWRSRLVPASFNGAQFHVEEQARTSGRRVVLHQYPKKSIPYAEDMGREAIRYQVTGYVIGPEYYEDKERLVAALESTEAGILVDPYMPYNEHLGYDQLMFVCERYSVSESRERGGYATFEMTFVEVGTPGNDASQLQNDTRGAMAQAADANGNGAAKKLDSGLPSREGIELNY